MNDNLKRILLFLAFSFGIPWISALVISQSSLMKTNPIQACSIANVIFISFPWLANIATRLLTKEGWKNLWLKPNIRHGWRYYLAAWSLPLLATIIGGLAFYLIFPNSFDPNLLAVRKLTESSPLAATINPWVLLLSITGSLFFISAPINSIASMGEEFGWRAYLLQKLMFHFANKNSTNGNPSGVNSDSINFLAQFSAADARKAAVLTGIIHGIWHLPLILLTIKVTPSISAWTPLVYLLLTTSLSILLSWGVLKSGSIWPASIGHGTGNAVAVLPGYLLAGQPIPLIGPDPTGLLGGIGFVILAMVLLIGKAFKVKPELIQIEPKTDVS